ncbi:MAG: dTDP-4-dehydrorhamnose 3,5-epimerase [Rikenellaceae bacterium]
MSKSKPKYSTQETPMEGAIIITPNIEGESREFLFDLEGGHDEYKLMGLDVEFVQHSSEVYARGVIEGLHFQRENTPAMIVAVTSGRALCVATDLRPECSTFGASHAVELTDENERMIYIPPYFSFGFMTLEPKTEVVCNYTGEYDPATQSSIIWDDEILAIDWQFERYDIDQKWLKISPKDKKAPAFRSYNQNTLWINRPKKSKYAMSY